MQMVKVRMAEVHGIFKEVTTAEDGSDFDIHITGFDKDGLPVRPVFEVPLTARLSHAIYNEKRLVDVTTRERAVLEEIEAARAELLARRAKQKNPATNYLQMTPEEMEMRLEAARQEGAKAAQAQKGK